MKKLRRVLSVFCIVAMLLSFTGCTFHRRTDNVFEQLYYEVRSVKRGQDSILLTGTETAFVDYDFGMFQNIQIPDLDMCLSFKGDSLYMRFFAHRVLYRYDVKNQTLYGEESLDYLNTFFLASYFNWYINAGAENEYSFENWGDYTFVLQDNVYYIS